MSAKYDKGETVVWRGRYVTIMEVIDNETYTLYINGKKVKVDKEELADG